MGLIFFSECSELVHLSTLSAKQLKGTLKKENIKKNKKKALVHLSTFFPNTLKGTRKKENMKQKESFLPICLYFLIMKYIGLIFFRACPPVHTFCKKSKEYNKERKHEIERQLFVHMSILLNNEIHMDAIKIFRIIIACPPVHTLCKKNF